MECREAVYRGFWKVHLHLLWCDSAKVYIGRAKGGEFDWEQRPRLGTLPIHPDHIGLMSTRKTERIPT